MRSIALVVLLPVLLANRAPEDERHMPVDLRCGGAQLRLDSSIQRPDGSTVRISMLRFYVSHLQARHKGRVRWRDEQVHLVDAADPATLHLPWPVDGAVDSLCFLLGVDSLTNVSGAFGGDLDPTKGMYWTWNSGYIDLKLEGTCSSRELGRGQFEFHLGGYRPPNVCARWIAVPVNGAAPVLSLDLDHFLQQCDLRKEPNVMSPGPHAVQLSGYFANAFNSHAERP